MRAIGVYSVVTALMASPAYASVHRWHATQTDGGLADGWHAVWTVNSGYSSPSAGGDFALYHLYFGIGAHANNQGTDPFNDVAGYGNILAFEEVGAQVGYLSNSHSTGYQFYWAVCDKPGTSPALCDDATNPNDYFEGPMQPAPALVLGHTYDFLAVGETHTPGGAYWWDLSIADRTVSGSYIRGGGHALSSTAEGCCSSYADWGNESDRNYTTDVVHLPQTDGGPYLTYKPIGTSNYYQWGPSTAYPASPGSAACWYARNANDTYNCGASDLLETGSMLIPYAYYRLYGY